MIGLWCTVWKMTTQNITCLPRAPLKLSLLRIFLAIFLLEEVPPMLLQSLDEPPFIHLPQDSGDLSVGRRCFQKLLISPLGCAERTHGEKGFHDLPQPCQQRSEPETGFLAWQCTGISTKLLQGRALWRGRAEKHQMEKRCCSVNIDRCSLLSLHRCCTDIPFPAAFQTVTLQTGTLLPFTWGLFHLKQVSVFALESEGVREAGGNFPLKTLLKDNSTNATPAYCEKWGERFCQCWSVFISLVLISHFGRKIKGWMLNRRKTKPNFLLRRWSL